MTLACSFLTRNDNPAQCVLSFRERQNLRLYGGLPYCHSRALPNVFDQSLGPLIGPLSIQFHRSHLPLTYISLPLLIYFLNFQEIIEDPKKKNAKS